MKIQFFFAVLCLTVHMSACSQSVNKRPASNARGHIGGGCEGCEAIYECPIAFEKLSNTDTLPDFHEAGQKIEISGIVYQRDGRTPAKNIVIYVYHTDQTGNYTPGKNAKGWEKRHGSIRGWVRTGEDGSYRFFTLKPAPYPGRRDPAHIHVTVKEPDLNEYWIDEYLFVGDPLLTKNITDRNENRGGDGVVKLTQEKGIYLAKRNITLGLNVPDYPAK